MEEGAVKVFGLGPSVGGLGGVRRREDIGRRWKGRA